MITPGGDPETAKAAFDWLTFFLKMGGYLLTFVTGIVSATWVVAQKVKGYDEKIATLQHDLMEERRTIGAKLDRLHQRIDTILLGKDSDNEYRHSKRIDDEHRD